MAVTLPPDLAGLLARTGHRWPDADEDQLVAMADGWKGLQDRLVTVRSNNSRTVQEIVAGNQSQAVAAVGDRGNEFDALLLQLVEICARAEAILIAVARAVLAAKKAIIDALAAVARTIADWKTGANDIPIVGWLISEAIENNIEEPVAGLTRAITWIVDKVANLILNTIIPRIVELIRLVKSLVQGLRKLIKLDIFGDWPTTPASAPGPAREPQGNPKKPHPNEKDKDNLRAIELENQAADTLAQAGYDIEQLPERQNKDRPNPDYEIQGVKWDAVTPTTGSARNVWSYIQEAKVNRGQAYRVIININDPDAQASVEALRRQSQEHDMPGLEEAKVIAPGGAIIDIYP